MIALRFPSLQEPCVFPEFNNVKKPLKNSAIFWVSFAQGELTLYIEIKTLYI